MVLCFWFGTDETSWIKCLALVARKKIDTLSVAMTMQQSMLNFEDKTVVNW